MRWLSMALVAAGMVSVAFAVDARQPPAPSSGFAAQAASRTPLILAAAEGERRIRRVMGGALAIIKVDRRNGGSPDLMMGYEEIPPGPATRVTLRNTGTEPLAIAYFFSAPGYEEYLRDTSVPDGQSAAPLSPAELATIRERHKRHIVFDPQ